MVDFWIRSDPKEEGRELVACARKKREVVGRRRLRDSVDGWDKARVPSIYIATRILVRGIWSLRF